MKIKMKPETLARCAKTRAAAKAASRAVLVARLQSKVTQEGQDSIWAELLAELEQNNPDVSGG